MTQTLPKGAQRVADRAGVASVHAESGCAFGGRSYVAYAAPGYWFPAVECGTVIASTVRELADYARPALIPADMPTPSGCTPAEPVAEPIEPTARAAWHAAPAGVDVVPFASVSDAVRFETAALFDARRYARSGVADAVADAADGYHADAVAVVVLASGNAADAETLQFAGVSYVRAGDGAEDCDAAFLASHAGAPSRDFETVADALAHAAGRAVRRSPVLPGEHAAPVLPSHGDRAPVLPVLPVLPGDPGYAAACYALPVKPAPLRKAATLRALAARVTSPAFAADLIARADRLEAIADGVPLADRVTQRAYDHAPLITR